MCYPAQILQKLAVCSILAGCLAILLAANTSAQSLRDTQLPAEFPPADFKGLQYVDSRGCVFIRAGFEGAPTWVPRVTRDRRQVCGFDPTFAALAATEISSDTEVVASVASARTAPVRAAPGQDLATPFVQVGTFGVEANATGTAARLRELGLPVKIDLLEFAGQTYRVVLAGPFSDKSDLQSALGVARDLGFSDAFLR